MPSFARLALFMSVMTPALQLGIGAWGSTWGWNLDGRMFGQVPAYLLLSYGLFLAPHALFRATPVSAYVTAKGKTLLVGSAPFLMWGIYTTGVSVLLVHVFDSRALWLGSIGSTYFGLILIVLAGIRLLL